MDNKRYLGQNRTAKEIRQQILTTKDIERKRDVEKRYKEKDKEIKRLATKDKQEYYEEILKAGKEAEKNHGLKNRWSILAKKNIQGRIMKEDETRIN